MMSSRLIKSLRLTVCSRMVLNYSKVKRNFPVGTRRILLRMLFFGVLLSVAFNRNMSSGGKQLNIIDLGGFREQKSQDSICG